MIKLPCCFILEENCLLWHRIWILKKTVFIELHTPSLIFSVTHSSQSSRNKFKVHCKQITSPFILVIWPHKMIYQNICKKIKVLIQTAGFNLRHKMNCEWIIWIKTDDNLLYFTPGIIWSLMSFNVFFSPIRGAEFMTSYMLGPIRMPDEFCLNGGEQKRQPSYCFFKL